MSTMFTQRFMGVVDYFAGLRIDYLFMIRVRYPVDHHREFHLLARSALNAVPDEDL